ncbi:hypothetical protein BGW41_004618 [Actinomortierella wolfii]|nr:hypothetical protein BGW41_004618 [Actinomortierella wolfii]
MDEEISETTNADQQYDESGELMGHKRRKLGDTSTTAPRTASPQSSDDGQVDLPDRAVLILYLIQQKLLGKESFYSPYFDMLPENIPTALSMSLQDLEFLQGTNAFQAAQELKAKLRTQYESTMQKVGHELSPEDYTWQKATWIKTETGVDMSGSFVKAGEQVFNNYGPRNNPDDRVALKANFSRDPNQDPKRAILERAGISLESLHYLTNDGIPASLLMAMRVMAMNPYEVEHFYGYSPMEERSMKDILEFVGFRNEFAMLDLLDMLLNSKMQVLRETDSFLMEPENDIQRYALIYREGQKRILNKSTQQLRDMFAALLADARDRSILSGNAPFLAPESARPSIKENQWKDPVDQETRTMSDLKEEAVRTLIVEARGIMVRYKDDSFGEALMTAFPNHGWGEKRDQNHITPVDHSQHTNSEEMIEAEDEMAIQLEQDAILITFLIFLRHCSQKSREETDSPILRFVRNAAKFDYASVLDEDMSDDALDLQASLKDVLEAVDDSIFSHENFSPEIFLWATGLLEVHSISFHMSNGQVISGVMPR